MTQAEMLEKLCAAAEDQAKAMHRMALAFEKLAACAEKALADAGVPNG